MFINKKKVYNKKWGGGSIQQLYMIIKEKR